MMSSLEEQAVHSRATGIVDVDEFAKKKRESEPLVTRNGQAGGRVEDASFMKQLFGGMAASAVTDTDPRTDRLESAANQNDSKLEHLEREVALQKKEVAEMKELMKVMAVSGVRKTKPAAKETALIAGFTSIIDVDDLVLQTFDDPLDATEKAIEMETFSPEQKQSRGDNGEESPTKDHEEEWHSPFSESTYTLLYICEATSQAFWYAIFVYLLQIVTIVLTLVDIIDTENEDNVLQIPPMVSIIVTCSQGVTLFLALAYQSDLIEAVLKLHDGYYPEVLEQFPGATFSTWIVSCVAQLIAGLLLLVTIFVLTMQVDNVLGMMLNFAALHFMAEIDDLGFSIAKMGFISNQLQHDTDTAGDFKVPKRDKGNLFRRILYFLALVGLFIGYAWLKSMQLNGRYLQTYLYVQFGDSHNPKIPYYSGLLSSDDERTAGHRQYRDVGTQDILLAYCYAESTWTFSDSNDPCEFFAQSPKTRSYDVTSIPGSQWVIKDSISRLSPFDSFTLIGRDCDKRICQGDCVDGICICPVGRFGLDCEFTNICPELSINEGEGLSPFPRASGSVYAVSKSFKQFYNPATGDPVRVYNMPVFYSTNTYPANVIFFGGRRWILTSEKELLGDNFGNDVDSSSGQTYFPNTTAAFLMNTSFHAHYQAHFTPWFLSDPLDFQSADFRPTPVGLWWSPAIPLNATERNFAKGYQLDTELICNACIEEQGGYCDLSGGNCSETSGECECKDGYSGTRCEIEEPCYEQDWPCIGEGLCDDISGVCRCNHGYYGKLCDIPYFCFEEDGKCLNGGVCNATLSTNCVCTDPSTWDITCAARDDCTIWGCLNGGICNPGTHICACQEPYHGYGCDLVNGTQEGHFCFVDGDCIDGTCDDLSGLCTCNNPNMYGTLCEHQYNCTMSGCMNNGLCNNVTELCECQKPFIGQNCNDVLDCSSDTDCIGPGMCNVTTGECACDGSHFGELCQFTYDCREREDGCYNGGTCLEAGQCKCERPYTGHMCWGTLEV